MIELNTYSRRVFVDGEEVVCTRRLFNTLLCFLENPDGALSRDIMMDKIWGAGVFVEYSSVRGAVRDVRKLIGKYRSAIERLYGEGYRFNPRKCPFSILTERMTYESK